MPELPEVETVRRMLASVIPGRTIARASASRHRLRGRALGGVARALGGRTFLVPRRTGKFLLLDLDGGTTLLSHLGMSGRWLFWKRARDADDALDHVHLKLEFEDGAVLWFQDIRRFGVARLVPTERLDRDPSLRLLGPDPIAEPPSGESLRALARGARVSVKNFLLDQKRIAGVGNIYASEVLFRARVDPRRRAGALALEEWSAIARETIATLGEAIERMGTTFSLYRTLWNEPGGYGEQLRVYDRAGEACRVCRTPVLRIVQGQRSTFYCPRCQSGIRRTRARPRPSRARAGA